MASAKLNPQKMQEFNIINQQMPLLFNMNYMGE